MPRIAITHQFFDINASTETLLPVYPQLGRGSVCDIPGTLQLAGVDWCLAELDAALEREPGFGRLLGDPRVGLRGAPAPELPNVQRRHGPVCDEEGRNARHEDDPEDD